MTADTGKNRDRYKDINSRALLAEEMNALAMVSLHTNAAPTPESARTARGTQVFYDSTNNAENRALATSVACYLRELITAQPGYQDWRMRETRDSDEYAENNGSMPSALVEIAFHTHVDDARALQDTTFRTASMKGVEKGHRMWREGKPCQALAINSVTNSSAPKGSKATSTIQFAGYPAFPVTLTLDIVQCPTGWSCTGGKSTYSSAGASSLLWDFTCRASTPGTVRTRSRLTDADGVKTKPVESTVTCTASTGTAVASQSSVPTLGSAL